MVNTTAAATTKEVADIAAKYAVEPIMDINVYWHTAIGLLDTWERYLRLRKRFQNANKVWQLIENEHDGDLCKLEVEMDEFDKLVDLTLSIFELVCINFNIEPVTREWLEWAATDTKSRRRLGTACKKFMYSRYRPVPLGSII